jgi:acyl-CoA synthetase (AMP-forming)/AMP-acid ligase II/3-hydroxymyristoyl/3-hydroxydecanoyl-(acyl carrier protein) dehydratase
MKIPFLGHRDGSQIVACRSSAMITAGEFLSDVRSLAHRLPSHKFTVNLCRDRYCFAVALAAAMLRDQISLLPATQAPESIYELRNDYGSLYLLVDDEVAGDFESVRVATGTGFLKYTASELAFARETTAAIAFTSGSTGTPVPNSKNWGALASGAIGEAKRFGLFEDASSVIVGTVPPQHMYGLETTVTMALQCGLIMHSEKPFFPADIRDTLANVDTDRVLITTPVHLRALLASDVDLPELRLVVSATAPLRAGMAKQFETRFGVEVHEVYGFTEAGMVATRRTVDGPAWHLLPELAIREAGGKTLVSGGHVPQEVSFSDIVEILDAEHFILSGRSTDIVNVAGKRTSMGYLDQILCELDGVEDGAFFMPDQAGDRVTRLVAFAVAPGRTREQLLEALAGRTDRAFLPRPLFLVDALPRNSLGKLPRGALHDLAVECACRSKNRPIVVKRSIESAHPALPGHFPDDPIVPGVVLLDEIVDVILSELPFASDAGWTVRSAKFLRPVRPGDCLEIRLAPESGNAAGGNTASGNTANVNAVRFECSVRGEMAASGALAQQIQGCE